MTAASTPEPDHEQVAEMFVTAAFDALGEVIDELFVFGIALSVGKPEE